MSIVTNKVQLMGHLGKEPMVKQFESGSKMASFTLATNESYTNTLGKRIESTQWHRLIAWGKLAEQVERMLHKGAKIMIEGKIRNSSYEAKDGTVRYATDIILDSFDLVVINKEAIAA